MSVVLDASAVLAMIFEERGGEMVLSACLGAYVSAVNLDEIVHKAARSGIAAERVDALLRRLRIEIIPFDAAMALKSAELHPLLHKLDISFGDRACFALALMSNRPILTADTNWAKLDLGLDIHLIR